MKTETIPHDLWQRHEQEWQAIGARPAEDPNAFVRPIWHRPSTQDQSTREDLKLVRKN